VALERKNPVALGFFLTHLGHMNLLRMNADQTRSAVSWIALGAVLFGVWLAPACAFMCASTASEAPGHCHHESGTGHGGSPTSGDHGCQTILCSHLQPGVQADLQSELVSPSPSFFHLSGTAEQVAPQVTSLHRPWLSALAIGPPVPPSLFAVLRA